MPSILDYLQGNNLAQSYYQDDPFYNVGRGVSQAQFGAPRNNTEAFLLPFLQSSLSTGLAEYGKGRAADALYQDLRSSYGQYLPETTVEPGTSIEDLLGSDTPSMGYTGAERPEGMSMKQMQTDLLFASKVKEAEIEQEQKKAEIKDQLEKSILLEGVKNKTISIKEALASSGKEDFSDLPESTENTAWWEAVPAADKQKLTQAKGVIGQLDKLAQDFETANMSAAEFRAKMDVSGTKANELKSRMMTLIPNTVRLMGDVGNLAEQEQNRVISATLGNFTSGTQGAATRIRNLADQSQGIMESKMGGYKAAQTNPSTLLDRTKPQSQKVREPLTQAQAQAEARRRGLIK